MYVLWMEGVTSCLTDCILTDLLENKKLELITGVESTVFPVEFQFVFNSYQKFVKEYRFVKSKYV